MCPEIEKMDVLDLIINILKEHEEKMGNLIGQLEKVIGNLYSVESKILGLNDTFSQALFSKTDIHSNERKKPYVVTQVSDWTEFRERSNGIHMVTYEVGEKGFTVNYVLKNVVYRYSELLPELKFQLEEGEKRYFLKKLSMDSKSDLSPVFEKRLKCGLDLLVKGSQFDLSENERLFQLKFYIDPIKAKRWLSEELQISMENVVEGKFA